MNRINVMIQSSHIAHNLANYIIKYSTSFYKHTFNETSLFVRAFIYTYLNNNNNNNHVNTSSFIRFINTRVHAAAYIKQCRNDDPNLLECLKASLHHLKPYLAQGIPEIEVIVTIEIKLYLIGKNLFR